MLPMFREEFGNPSSVHACGGGPRARREEARARVAALLGCCPVEVVFTSGGTESDNHAIKGTAFALREQGHAHRHLARRAPRGAAHLPLARAAPRLLGDLPRRGRRRPGRPRGGARGDHARRRCSCRSWPRTTRAAASTPSRRSGASAASAACSSTPTRCRRSARSRRRSPTGASTCSRSRGTRSTARRASGVLYIREGVAIDPLMHGGGHEIGRRAGTEHTSGIVGLGKAAELARLELDAEAAQLTALRDELWARIRAQIPDVRLNGHPTERLPNTLNVSFPRIEAESALMLLDRRGLRGLHRLGLQLRGPGGLARAHRDGAHGAGGARRDPLLARPRQHPGGHRPADGAPARDHRQAAGDVAAVTAGRRAVGRDA